MYKQTDYITRIRKLGGPGLRELWAQIAAGRTPGWPPGTALEYLVLRAFELDGCEVRWLFTVEVADETLEQIDGVVYVDHFACLIGAKDTMAAIDFGALAKLRTQLARRPAGAIGMVVSRTAFTSPALTLASYFAPQTVLLVSGAELEQALEDEEMVGLLVAKYRECVEEGGQEPLPLRTVTR